MSDPDTIYTRAPKVSHVDKNGMPGEFQGQPLLFLSLDGVEVSMLLRTACVFQERLRKAIVDAQFERRRKR